MTRPLPWIVPLILVALAGAVTGCGPDTASSGPTPSPPAVTGPRLADCAGPRTAAGTAVTAQTYRGHGAAVTGVAFAPDGASVVSAGDDGQDRIWSAPGAAEVSAGVGQYPTAVAWSPSGGCVAGATSTGSIVIWRAGSGATVVRLSAQHDRVYGLAWSPDGTALASGSWDGTAVLWDAATGRAEHTFHAPRGGVGQVAFSPDSTRVALALATGDVVVLRVADATPVWQAHLGDAPLWALAWSPDGRTLAAGVGDYGADLGGHYAVTLLAAATGKVNRVVHPTTGPVWTVAFSPDGRRLAVAGGSFSGLHPPQPYADYRVAVVAVPDGAPVAADRTHTDSVWGLSWSPDGTLLASASQDGSVIVARTAAL